MHSSTEASRTTNLGDFLRCLAPRSSLQQRVRTSSGTHICTYSRPKSAPPPECGAALRHKKPSSRSLPLPLLRRRRLHLVAHHGLHLRTGLAKQIRAWRAQATVSCWTAHILRSYSKKKVFGQPYLRSKRLLHRWGGGAALAACAGGGDGNGDDLPCPAVADMLL